MRPYGVQLALTVVATVAQPVLGAARIWLLKVLVDGVLGGQHFNLLLAVCGGFRDVSFGYDPRHSVLRGFDLTIAPGQTVALVGASGAGKTTVVSLLLNYYDADSGVLTIDGHDVRQLDPPSVRGQIAAELQEPMLFQASVRENLRYGRLDASDADVEAAAVVAQADTFIRQLPDGYDTPVGPRGARLSGGQRQRLAIARAVLKNAPVVVLDEATSALDPETESAVLDGLRASMAGCAVLIVAHRISTVRHADRIAVLHAGRVAEFGTHAELLAAQGLYSRFYGSQQGVVALELRASGAVAAI